MMPVIHNDPRAVLDMLSKPVECDDDEFLDRIDKKASFHSMPDKPVAELNVGVVDNEAQQRMLDGLADSRVVEEDLDGGAGRSALNASSAPVQLTDRQRQFYSLFHGVSGSDPRGGQASVPDSVLLEAVRAQVGAEALPRVDDTPEERAAKEEELERRAAWIASQGGGAERKPSAGHERFVALMDGVRGRK